jgi:hypothetical protein
MQYVTPWEMSHAQHIGVLATISLALRKIVRFVSTNASLEFIELENKSIPQESLLNE